MWCEHVWRGHSCPRSLPTKPDDLSLLSLPSRSRASDRIRRRPRHLRPSIRKKRFSELPARRPVPTPRSLPQPYPRASSRRNHSGKCHVLHRRRRSRHRRHSSIPGKRNRHGSQQTAPLNVDMKIVYVGTAALGCPPGAARLVFLTPAASLTPSTSPHSSKSPSPSPAAAPASPPASPHECNSPFLSCS